jgi:hypothetical protein
MATAAVSGFGTLMQRGDGGSPEVFSTIAEVRSIGALNLTIEMIDATNHSSTGGYRELLPSFKDAGEITFDMNFLPSDPSQSPAAGLILDYNNKTKRNYRIQFPNIAATKVIAAGYITGFNITAPIDDRLAAAVTIKITGEPTWS